MGARHVLSTRAGLLHATLLAAATADADIYHLLDGDRITGKTLSKTARAFRVETAYGRLVIPRARVLKIVHDDGREEVLSEVLVAVPTPEATPAPPPPLRLELLVTGDQFWQAWAPKDAPPDTRLRFQVTLDGEPVAAYVDAREDPEIRGARVNAMSFAPDEVTVVVADGVSALKPDTRPGRITLRLELPGERAGDRSLRVAYQTNAGSASSAQWRDVVHQEVRLELGPGGSHSVEIRQRRGEMQYSRRRMHKLESFTLEMSVSPLNAR
jgi:hypothetical protein